MTTEQLECPTRKVQQLVTRFPDIYRLFLKEEGILRSVVTALTFLGRTDTTELKMNHYFFLKFFNFLCSIVNKIWVYKICKLLYSVFRTGHVCLT